MMTALYLILVTLVFLFLAIQDWKTTYVSFPGLILLTLLTALTVFYPPFDTPAIEHALGALVASTSGFITQKIMNKIIGKPAFGEADIWMLTAGGFLIGLQWVPFMFGLTSLLGIIVYPLLKRQDVEGKSGPILALLPILALVILLIAWARYFNILPQTLL